MTERGESDGLKSVFICIVLYLNLFFINLEEEVSPMKHKVSKIKRVTLTALAAVCALSSVAAISAGAVSSSKSVPLKNGYTHQLSFNVGKSSGSADYDITNGGFCRMKDSITAIEYTSGGAFVRNVSAETTKSDVKNLSVSVSRKSGTSNVLKNYIATGYNYSSTAKSRSNATTYFEAVEIGNASIKTKIINP